jgi:hypothetical protein
MNKKHKKLRHNHLVFPLADQQLRGKAVRRNLMFTEPHQMSQKLPGLIHRTLP